MTDSTANPHGRSARLPGDQTQPLRATRESTEGATADPATLYRTHATFVWRMLRRLGVPQAHLEDAAHEVFVVVCRRRGDLRDPALARSWLYGIARRVALESNRRGRRESGHADPQSIAAPDPGPERDAQTQQAAQLARTLLGQVDERFRTVLVMAEMESMTGPEIAAALELKLNTVYSRLRVGREQFQAALARHRARERRVTKRGGTGGR